MSASRFSSQILFLQDCVLSRIQSTNYEPQDLGRFGKEFFSRGAFIKVRK